jgi:hypothetical protein
MAITETQSFGYDIRNSMFDIVTADPFFADYTCRKTRMLPVQVDLIPYLGVYIVDELMVPDGDANAGCIRFNHTTRIGFSVIQANNDQDALESGLDAAYLKIMSLLWTDIKFMNVLFNDNEENVGVESVLRGTRRHVFGSAQTDNETPFGELQYEVSVFNRSEWYPDITDTLDEIDVTVAPNNVDVDWGGTSPAVQPITIKYMFDSLRKALVKEDRDGQG